MTRTFGLAQNLVSLASYGVLLIQFSPWAVLLLVLGLYAASSLLRFVQGYLLTGVVQNTLRRMRNDVEDKLNRMPLSYFDRQHRGELLSRVTNDLDNVSQTLQQTMSQLLTAILTIVSTPSMYNQ